MGGVEDEGWVGGAAIGVPVRIMWLLVEYCMLLHVVRWYIAR